MSRTVRVTLFAVLFINSTFLYSNANVKQANDESETAVCPTSCFCDEKNIYVSCVGDAAWDLSFPSIPRTVSRLEIRNYNIRALNLQFLRGMSALQELKLQQTKIDSIANSTFAHINKLERLDLGENQIENLTSNTFDGLEHSLLYIDLSSNRLRNIDGAFKHLSALEQLNLRKNRLQNLTMYTFAGLQKLQYLNLDANEIQFIEAGSLILLPNLAHLLLSNNPLSSLSRLDSVTRRLQYVDISNIGLTAIPQGIEPFVRDLRLARNNIVRISSGELDNYSHLSLLVLDDNQIDEIEQDALGRLEYLIRLWLNGNKLKTIAINLPQSLRELYLEENVIEEIDSNSFKSLPNLERLYLKRNQIRRLGDASFRDLQSLKVLDLQANRIHNLTADVFVNLTALERLDLSQNNLMFIHGECFAAVANLQVLQLSYIESSEIMFDENLFAGIRNLQTLQLNGSPELVARLLSKKQILQSLRSVQELNLMNNKLKNLSSGFTSFFPNLRTIKLNGNLWHCDKSMLWLIDWMRNTKSVNFDMSQEVKCSSPASLQFKPIKLLTVNDLPQTVTMNSKPLAVSKAADSSSNQITTETLLFAEKAKETYKKSNAGNRKNITLFKEQTTDQRSNATVVKSTLLNATKILKENNNSGSSSGKRKIEFKSSAKTMNAENVSSVKTVLNNEQIANKSNRDSSKSKEDVLTSVDVFHSQRDSKRERKHIPNTSKQTLISSQFIKDTLSRESRLQRNVSSATIAIVALGSVLLIVVGVSVYCTHSKYKKYLGVNESILRTLRRSLRRRNSVSYSSQNDEVSIATIANTANVSVYDESDTNFVFRNKLYFAVNNESNTI
ncbi:Slit-like protein [Leptotrombidium deliense]|uniref:Slit-like protein n=1 Tax=Leptotrombidium deliense TaxID=299467 RepID=A0A443SNA6_9ACAR|nr:Slit-like protein [Leptotrombidium deliense]